MSSKTFLCQSLGLQTSINMRDDKIKILGMITIEKQSVEKVHKIKNLGNWVKIFMLLKQKHMILIVVFL